MGTAKLITSGTAMLIRPGTAKLIALMVGLCCSGVQSSPAAIADAGPHSAPAAGEGRCDGATAPDEDRRARGHAIAANEPNRIRVPSQLWAPISARLQT